MWGFHHLCLNVDAPQPVEREFLPVNPWKPCSLSPAVEGRTPPKGHCSSSSLEMCLQEVRENSPDVSE